MGSPLSPLLANIFMTVSEVEAINSSPMKPKFWHRYVDDVFTIWPHGQAALKDFLSHLNSRHRNITFSMEPERDHQLPFLDVTVN
jgi:retron-type reverse transcriptase